MLIHPPMLLAGYMSWTIPFCFAIAALVSGRVDNDWLPLVRRWTLFAWAILGFGNLLGAWWAYHVLGWGGYWGWDPVENCAIMPWLTGTAFLHSIQIQERRGMLKIWNMALVTLTFCPGDLRHLHRPQRRAAVGPLLRPIVDRAVLLRLPGASSSIVSVALLFWRMPRLRADRELDSLISREAAFLLNNLLFIARHLRDLLGHDLPADLRGGARR